MVRKLEKCGVTNLRTEYTKNSFSAQISLPNTCYEALQIIESMPDRAATFALETP
jgi:hypothetical protein